MRANNACERCRRQKLKCDADKPCLLCRRSGVECQPRSYARRTTLPSTISGHKSVKRKSVTPRSPPETTILKNIAKSGGYTTFRIISPQSESATVDAPTSRNADQQALETPEFGANTSAIDFAKNLYGRDANKNPKCAASIPTEFRTDQSRSRNWTLLGMNMPDVSLMQALIDQYFRRNHWFIFVFHEPTLRRQAQEILGRESWNQQERGAVLATFMVTVMALQTVSNDETWPGHRVLKEQGMDCTAMRDQLIAEVRRHLLDLLEDCQIEAVQVCLLLGTFYIFNGNPNLAWAVLGMATRAGYALTLHSERAGNRDKVVTQVRRRCWNQLKITDAFCSMIYGRPASLDPAFGSMQALEDMDDTITLTAGLKVPGFPSSVSQITFYSLKNRMYEIIAEILSRFRLLQIRSSPSPRDWASLYQIIHEITSQLNYWQSCVPLHLQLDQWRSLGIDGTDQQVFKNDVDRILFVQAVTTEVLFNGTVILLHRPVLENMIASLQSSEAPRTSSSNKSFGDSLSISVSAATRISETPIELLANQTMISYALMHLFTAGVILCIPPHTMPFSVVAQDCKSAVVRMITLAKKLHKHSPVAGLTQQLLGDLLRITIQREMDAALVEDAGLGQERSKEQARAGRNDHGDGPKSSEILPINMQPDSVPLYLSPDGGGNAPSIMSPSNVSSGETHISPSDSNVEGVDTPLPNGRPDLDAYLRSLYSNDSLEVANGFGTSGPNEALWPFQAFGHAMFGLGMEDQLPP